MHEVNKGPVRGGSKSRDDEKCMERRRRKDPDL
jgi:hypothetical protein